MNITETLSRQGREPTGGLGRVTARVMPVIFRSLYAKVADRLALRPDDYVLDVACGSGAFLKKHAAHVQRVAGLDHSQIQIDLAMKSNRARVDAGTAEFVQGDATALPWDDDTFSAVTSNCVHCFAEPQRSLQEMARVLRRGGRAVVVLQGTVDQQHSGEVDRWGVPSFSDHEVRRMMINAGFSDPALSFDHGSWFVEAVKR